MFRDPDHGTHRRLTPEGRRLKHALLAGKWVDLRQSMMVVQSRGRLLMVGCVPAFDGTYGVIAIESPIGGSIDDFFAHHAHKMVANDVPSHAKARAIAEKYARGWKRSKAPIADRCGCGEIGQTEILRQGAGVRLVTAPPTPYRNVELAGLLADFDPEGLPPGPVRKSSKVRRRVAYPATGRLWATYQREGLVTRQK